MADSNPYQPPESGDTMARGRLSEVRYLKAWLIFFVVATLVGFGIGMVLGAVAGIILAAQGVDLTTAGGAITLLGWIVGLPISFVFYRWSVQKFILPQVA